ncbi:MAG: hypothetical protein ACTSSH_14200 [Candidatus Heimdallarchaeota archaeon]
MNQISLSDRVSKLKSLTTSESMILLGDLIDDLVQTYLESLRMKYPDASFDALIQYGHEESHYKLRRREFND